MSDDLTLDTRVEELIERFPSAAAFLLKKGVRCIRCGEPVWGTLGELLDTAGIPDREAVLRDLAGWLKSGAAVS